MQADDQRLIRVQSQWNGWRSAEVRLADLADVHWFQPDGAPQALVHGYVECGKLVTGSIPHDCDPVSAPHRLRVCILKKHTIPGLYGELAKRIRRQTAPIHSFSR